MGKKLPKEVVKIDYQEVTFENGVVKGNIPVLDIQYGNVWTNIPDSLVYKMGVKYGDSVQVEIQNKDSSVFKNTVPLVKTFGSVPEGSSLAYFNSLMNFSLAINQGDFSKTFKVYSGPEWSIKINK